MRRRHKNIQHYFWRNFLYKNTVKSNRLRTVCDYIVAMSTVLFTISVLLRREIIIKCIEASRYDDGKRYVHRICGGRELSVKDMVRSLD